MSLAVDAPVEAVAAIVDGRVDYDVIAELIEPGSRILDVGCADGGLMALLKERHGVRASGIELDPSNVAKAVGRGLSVVHGDADTDLSAYPDNAFDYVILSQTLQATRDPKSVLENLLRIGERSIVSFPNFGHWSVRMQLLLSGRMPNTGLLPEPWWATQNIHFCTIRDFVELCEELNVDLQRAIAMNRTGRRVPINAPWWFWNLFGEQAVFLLKR